MLAWTSLEDLHFGFLINFDPHRPYKIFNEILALEKILKALLLYHSGSKYENLCENQSEKVVEELAKQYGHKIKKMLKEARLKISKKYGKVLLSKEQHL